MRWEISDSGDITLEVKEPFDCTAELIQPDIDSMAKIAVQGMIVSATGQPDQVTIELHAGQYRFDYRPLRDYIPRYHLEMPLRELLANCATQSVLQTHIPAVLALPFLGMLENESLLAIAKKTFFPCPPQVVAAIGEEITEYVVG